MKTSNSQKGTLSHTSHRGCLTIPLFFCAGFLLLLEVGQVQAQVPAIAQNFLVSSHARADELHEQGNQKFYTGDLTEALELFNQELILREAAGDRLGLAQALKQQGRVLSDLNEYRRAIAALEQARVLYEELGSPRGVAETLTYLGAIYINLDQEAVAQDLLESALGIHQTLENTAGIGETLYYLGEFYNNRNEYDQALDVLQKSLLIRQEVGDRFGEARTLQTIGLIYWRRGEPGRSLEILTQGLQINREVGDRVGIGRTLLSLGSVYDSQGEYYQALELLEEALILQISTGNRVGEAGSLRVMGLVYQHLGDYQKSLELYWQALAIYQETGERASESTILNNIAGIYYNVGQYPDALEFYQRSLAIVEAINYKFGRGRILNNIGLVHAELGDYVTARKFYLQALEIRRAVQDRQGEASTLHNLGIALEELGDREGARETLHQALEIREMIGDRSGIGATSNSIGLVYAKMGQHSQALNYYNRALEIGETIGNRPSVGRILNSIGVTYQELQNFPQALDFFNRALDIFEEIDDKIGRSIAFANLAYLKEQQNQPASAITFYKKSIILTEEIRRELQVLSIEQQQSFTRTVAEVYRALANLLLEQGRLLEAQQVLELLKVEELREFTQNARAGGETQDILMTGNETNILEQHGSLIAFGKTVQECRQNRCDRLGELLDQREALTREYHQAIATIESEIRRRRGLDDAFLDPTLFSRKAREIVEAQPGTILIYPLILEDKIWILWAASGGIIKTVEIPNIGQQEIAEAVLQFRGLLNDIRTPISQIQNAGAQLYEWLVQPIEAELQANEIKHLVFSLDRITRYIPMNALFDGENYLIENYGISTILSADLTNMSDRPTLSPEKTSVLALGLSEAISGFNALPYVQYELEGIVKQDSRDSTGIYPGLKFLNQEFDFRSLRDNLYDHQILHIATHGEFVPGSPDLSYLLLGNGEKLAIPDITTLQDLADVHLVVLSACETALGGPGQDGTEIAGLSYYFLNHGVAAVIASLWKVDDLSTSLLMQEFYQNLAQGTMNQPVTKTEALRSAQINLITGDSYNHPRFWAPFILIGNGL
jgi:CHAT domain-containing protein/tetratricopeptide (TPR) repeat protein